MGTKEKELGNFIIIEVLVPGRYKLFELLFLCDHENCLQFRAVHTVTDCDQVPVIGVNIKCFCNILNINVALIFTTILQVEATYS